MHANTIKADIRTNNRSLETDAKLLSFDCINQDSNAVQRIKLRVERKTKRTARSSSQDQRQNCSLSFFDK